MTSYAGLDVSQQETEICVISEKGAVVWRGKAPTEPGALSAALRGHAPQLERLVLETGALSGWLCQGLLREGLPAVCIDARAAHGALKQRRSKPVIRPAKRDRGDRSQRCRGAGPAGANRPPRPSGLGPFGDGGAACWRAWYTPVRLRSPASQELRALLMARDRLVRMQRDLMSQTRGMLKPFGLVLPRTTPRRLTQRIQAWLDQAEQKALQGGLRAAVTALLQARTAIAEELSRLDGILVRRAGTDPVCRRLATIPGVGAVTASCFVSVVGLMQAEGR